MNQRRRFDRGTTEAIGGGEHAKRAVTRFTLLRMHPEQGSTGLHLSAHLAILCKHHTDCGINRVLFPFSTATQFDHGAAYLPRIQLGHKAV